MTVEDSYRVALERIVIEDHQHGPGWFAEIAQQALDDGTPGADVRYRLTQRLHKAVRWLREAEDIARVELPVAMPTADRIRSIYEQVTADLLDGRVGVAPIAQRLQESQDRELRLANALEQAGVTEERIRELWGP